MTELQKLKKLKKLKGACVVLAFCYVTKQNEETIERMCTLHGFEPGRGLTDVEYLACAKMLGIKLRKAINFQPTELKKFQKEYKKGLYVLVTHDHMLVLDNGLIVDPREGAETGRTRRKIINAWKVRT